jgi:hypothetical protein
MKIKGIEGMTVQQVRDELDRGARFVYFPYCISAVVMTFRRASDIHFVRAGESTMGKALPYAATSLLLGWWGIPWGLIWTPAALYHAFRGGKDVTAQVAASFAPAAPGADVPGPMRGAGLA